MSSINFGEPVTANRNQESYIYAPTADITTYELAQILPVLIASPPPPGDSYSWIREPKISATFYSNLPSECQKHFKTPN